MEQNTVDRTWNAETSPVDLFANETGTGSWHGFTVYIYCRMTHTLQLLNLHLAYTKWEVSQVQCVKQIKFQTECIYCLCTVPSPFLCLGYFECGK